MNIQIDTNQLNEILNELISLIVHKKHLDRYCESLHISFNFDKLIDKIKGLFSEPTYNSNNEMENDQGIRRANSIFDINLENTFETQQGEYVILISLQMNTYDNPTIVGSAELVSMINFITPSLSDEDSDFEANMSSIDTTKMPVTIKVTGFPFQADFRLLIKVLPLIDQQETDKEYYCINFNKKSVNTDEKKCGKLLLNCCNDENQIKDSFNLSDMCVSRTSELSGIDNIETEKIEIQKKIVSLKITIDYSIKTFKIDPSCIDYIETNLENIKLYKFIMAHIIEKLNENAKKGLAGEISFITSLCKEDCF